MLPEMHVHADLVIAEHTNKQKSKKIRNEKTNTNITVVKDSATRKLCGGYLVNTYIIHTI